VASSAGRDEVERAVEARIVGLGDIDLGEQREKSVALGASPPFPNC